MEQITFLHLSDTHLSFETPCPAICSAPSLLESAYRAAAGLDTPPQFVLITGDVVHEGGADDYAKARGLIDRLDAAYGVRTCILLGNHDRHAAFYEGYLGEAGRTGRYYYSCMAGGLRLLALDSAVDDQVPGHMDVAQLDWLEQQLSLKTDAPTIVALHHPPCGTSVRQTNANNLGEGARFADILRRHPAAAVLAGHKHFVTATALPGGTPVYTGAGLAFGIELPCGGTLRFTKSGRMQYCTFYDGQLFYSPLDLGEAPTIAQLTPAQMRNYHGK